MRSICSINCERNANPSLKSGIRRDPILYFTIDSLLRILGIKDGRCNVFNLTLVNRTSRSLTSFQERLAFCDSLRAYPYTNGCLKACSNSSLGIAILTFPVSPQHHRHHFDQLPRLKSSTLSSARLRIYWISMSTRTQQNGRSFFNFPPEIPNIIYRELLRDLDVPIDVWQQDNPEYPGEPLRTNYPDKADPYLNCPHYKRSRPRLLRTCRHVLDEAPPSLWEWLPGVEYGTCSGVCRSGWSSVWDGRCQTQTRRPGLLFGGVAVVFFDDVCISTRPVSAGLIFSKDSPRNPISYMHRLPRLALWLPRVVAFLEDIGHLGSTV